MSSTTFPTHPPRASGDARLRQPVFRCPPPSLSQTRRAESLRCHSAHCFAGPIRSRGSSSSVAATGFPRSLPSRYRLGRLNHSNPCAYTPSPKPLPPARLTRSKVVAVLLSFDCQCQSRKDRHLSPRPYIPSGSCRACRLACPLSGRQKERCFRIALSDFLRVERRILARSKVSA